MKKASVQHGVLTLAEWNFEDVTSEPLSLQPLSYFPLFALGERGDLNPPLNTNCLRPTIERTDYFKFTYGEQRVPFLFLLMIRTVLLPNLSKSEGHL